MRLCVSVRVFAYVFFCVCVRVGVYVYVYAFRKNRLSILINDTVISSVFYRVMFILCHAIPTRKNKSLLIGKDAVGIF